jgi:cysteine desulfurase/selenocysteine lyase
MLGPTGIGVLYGRRETLETLEPGVGGSEMIKEVWLDHAQWNDLPWRFEPGTPPIAEAVGLHAAVDYLDKLGMDRVSAHERDLTRRCLDALAVIPGVTIYGPRNPEIKGAVVAFNVEGLHPHDGAALLDQSGVAVRAGHHCAQPLARRLGISGTLRASFSVYNTASDVERLAEAVAGLRDQL